MEKLTKKEFLDSFAEALDYISKDDYNHAITILNYACMHIPEDHTQDGKYFVSYNHFLEPFIYSGLYDKTEERLKKLPYKTPVEYNSIYRLYGVVLFKVGKLEEAKKMLNKSIEWNPISSQALLDLAEIYKIQEDYENMFKYTLIAHKYAYDRGVISKIFCNYGYYFCEKEDYDTAISMYIVSDSYLASKTAANELKYISEKTGKKKFTRPSREEMQKICHNAGVYYGLNIKVPELIKAVASKAKEDGNEELAKNALEAFFSLTADREIYNLLRKTKKDGEKEMKSLRESQEKKAEEDTSDQ